MSTTRDVYGDIYVSTKPASTTVVGHISGAQIERDKQDRPSLIRVHYVSDAGPRVIAMSFGDAMFLLSTLKSIQLDLGVPFPDDPRDPNWKAKK